MSTEAKIQPTSTELGRIWMSYQIESMMIAVFGNLRDSTIDEEAKNILNSSVIEDEKIISELKKYLIIKMQSSPLHLMIGIFLEMRRLSLMILLT